MPQIFCKTKVKNYNDKRTKVIKISTINHLSALTRYYGFNPNLIVECANPIVFCK